MEVQPLSEFMESTSAMARDLEALRNEHQSLLTGYQAAGTLDYDEAVDERPDGEVDWDPELEEAVKREKEELVNESMKKLEAGMTESKLMLMLVHYANSLESDRQKLKAQVKRLCSENNWLRQELTTHQQLLQEVEISLCKVREEKEQLDFLLSQERRDKRGREQSPDMDIDVREEDEGPNHPDVAKQFTNLAILCTHLGKYDEVEYYYQRALEIYQAELGADDPNVTKTMSNLANCYLKQGKYQAAESIFKKVLTTVQKGEGPQTAAQDASSWVLNSSPRSPTGRGKEEGSSDKGGWHKANPPQSPTISSTLKNLSVVYREQGRLDTANELDKLTERRTLDQSQRERMNELLSEVSSSPAPSPRASQLGRAPQGSSVLRQQKPRGSLSLNVRRLFGLKGTDSVEQDGGASNT